MQNGKGDKSRVTNLIRYRDNFDSIDWDLPKNEDSKEEELPNNIIHIDFRPESN